MPEGQDREDRINLRMKTEDFDPQGFVLEARDGPIVSSSEETEPDPPSGVKTPDSAKFPIILHLNLWENAAEVVDEAGNFQGYHFKTLDVGVLSYAASAGALLFRKAPGIEEGMPWGRIASYSAERKSRATNTACKEGRCDHRECDAQKWSTA